MAEQVTIQCPNCGFKHKREVEVILKKPLTTPRQPHTNGKWLQSNAPAIPGTWVGQLWHRVVKNKPLEIEEDEPELLPTQERIILRTEHKPTSGRQLLDEFKMTITETQAWELARVYVEDGLSWSKENTKQNTTMGSGLHDVVKNEFLRARFLEDVGRGKKIEYQLTEAGVRFLTYYLYKAPSSPSLWRVIGEIRGAVVSQ